MPINALGRHATDILRSMLRFALLAAMTLVAATASADSAGGAANPPESARAGCHGDQVRTGGRHALRRDASNSGLQVHRTRPAVRTTGSASRPTTLPATTPPGHR